MKIQGTNINPVFLKSSTGRHWLNAIKLKVTYNLVCMFCFFYIVFLYRVYEVSLTGRSHNKAALLPAHKNTFLNHENNV